MTGGRSIEVAAKADFTVLNFQDDVKKGTFSTMEHQRQKHIRMSINKVTVAVLQGAANKRASQDSCTDWVYLVAIH